MNGQVHLAFTPHLQRLEITLPDGTPYPGFLGLGKFGRVYHHPSERLVGQLALFEGEWISGVASDEYGVTFLASRLVRVHVGLRGIQIQTRWIKAFIATGRRHGPVVIDLGRGGCFGRIRCPEVYRSRLR